MSKNIERHPMLLSPVFKDYLWGGERLINEYNKTTDLRPVAESWELSCHHDGLSAVASGVYAGRTLAEVLDENPDWVVCGESGVDASPGGINVTCESGVDASPGGNNPVAASDGIFSSGFPILIKLIDAKQDLSIQVHPGDDYARRHENSAGKNEAWYVVGCEPGTRLILGLKESIQPQMLEAALKNGSIPEYVHSIEIKPGDCYCVPAGLLHAICGGALIAEFQQSSNITYRVFDYNRIGPDGKPRRLDIEHASRVIDCAARAINSADNAVARQFSGYSSTELVEWPYFKLTKLDIHGEANLTCGGAFQALLVIDGAVDISYAYINQELSQAAPLLSMLKGTCAYVPAGLGAYTLRGRGQVLLTTA